MSSQRKPSIVFVRGLWADGSCFSKLIPTLQEEGFDHALLSARGEVSGARVAAEVLAAYQTLDDEQVEWPPTQTVQREVGSVEGARLEIDSGSRVLTYTRTDQCTRHERLPATPMCIGASP